MCGRCRPIRTFTIHCSCFNARGNPVIVRVRLASVLTHFVVIAGKDGFDYLVRDPGAGSAKGLYPLCELGSNIEALRFYEPIASMHSHTSAQAK